MTQLDIYAMARQRITDANNVTLALINIRKANNSVIARLKNEKYVMSDEARERKRARDRARNKARTPEQKAERAAYMREWRAREYNEKYRERNKERMRLRRLRIKEELANA